MNSIKRTYLACRAAVAEIPPLMYFLSIGILVTISTFILLVEDDSDVPTSQLLQEFSFWDPTTIVGLITSAGWIAGLVMCATIHTRWFKEENQAVRTLSLPLSNGERFAALIVLYLLFVPLVSFGLPLLAVILIYPLVPGTVLLPAPVYLLQVMTAGFLTHAIVTVFWIQPSFAFGKKVAFVIITMIAAGIFYVANTHGQISDTVDVSYTTPVEPDPMVVGVARYDFFEEQSPDKVIKVGFSPEDDGYAIGLGFFLLVMLGAGGLALTKKTA